MSIQRINPDSSKRSPAGPPSLRAAVVYVLLPLVVGLLSEVAQGLWHDYYWGIPFLGGGEYKTRTHTVSFDTVAWPLWLLSAAFFLIVAFYSTRLATRRGSLWVVGTGVAILAGGLLLAMAALGVLMGA